MGAVEELDQLGVRDFARIEFDTDALGMSRITIAHTAVGRIRQISTRITNGSLDILLLVVLQKDMFCSPEAPTRKRGNFGAWG